MVRLQLGWGRDWGLELRLSIPLWCDCNPPTGGGEEGGGEDFQSHYGAIATLPNVGHKAGLHRFQSHYGAIATRRPCI